MRILENEGQKGLCLTEKCGEQISICSQNAQGHMSTLIVPQVMGQPEFMGL